jgi:small neutral amino acid transporter SnatA (MarC family)
MLDTYGLVPTFVALLLNMVIVWWSLVKTDLIIKIFGQAGTRAFAKIMYILLAAIGVMMIRKGMTSIIQGAF